MSGYVIRKIMPDEHDLLEDFLYEAIFQSDENNLLPREIIRKPELDVYIKGFGKPDDYCLVAETDGKVVGAVWARILTGDIKGFGYYDDNTPELAISLYKEYRQRGIGTALMRQMLILLKEQGFSKTSLSVEKENYAAKMYENLGYKIVDEPGKDYLMIFDLSDVKFADTF